MRAIDWEALREHERTVRRVALREEPAGASAPVVEPERVLAYRARASHLGERLPAASLAAAAWGGLQDSAPRAALLALHARCDGVGPQAWEDPSLVQIWFRWADYVVPRADVDVFTLGAMPREPRYARALEELAEAVVETLREGVTDPGAVASSLGEPFRALVPSANVTGRFHIRWDARTVTLLPAPAPTTDPEEARLELARRFLRWLGPQTARAFARWARVSVADAGQTWAALAPELGEVSLGGARRWLLGEDLEALRSDTPAPGPRFLPQGDPFLRTDARAAHPEPSLHLPGVDKRLVNSLTGRVLLEGDLVASWGRRQHHLTIAPWRELPARAREAIAAEADAMAGPIGRPMAVRWLEPA